MCAKMIIFGILLHVGCENGKYLASIIDDSVITCDKIIKKKQTYSNKNSPNKKGHKKF